MMMGKKKPTVEQKNFAHFLLKEDDDENSVLYNKFRSHVYTGLVDICDGKWVSNMVRDDINKKVKQLDSETDGYITKMWNKPNPTER